MAAIARLANLLGPDAELSHIRAVALACGDLAARHAAAATSAAATLRRLLDLPGMAGHARERLPDLLAEADPDTCHTATREACLRELHLVAALHRCGDAAGRDGLAAWRRDLRGHYARHATALLAEG